MVQGGAYFQKPSNITNEDYLDVIKTSAKKGYEVLTVIFFMKMQMIYSSSEDRVH